MMYKKCIVLPPCEAKKFILDALVKLGKLKDDNRKCVYAFKDAFGYGLTAKVNEAIKSADTAVGLARKVEFKKRRF